MEPPTVAVVVVSFNTKQLLLECLESIRSEGSPAAIETVVVDNASSDGTSERVRELYPEVRLIPNSSNLGFAGACNQGIRSTGAPFVLLLNSDARLGGSTLESLVSCLESNPRCAAAGCSLVDASGRERPNTWRFLTPFNQALELAGLTRLVPAGFRRSYRPKPNPAEMDCSVDWIEASCLMLRRAALDEVGLFDERFFMYSEDEDLCWRLRRSGWVICNSRRGRVVHHGGASARQDAFQSLRHFYRSQYLLLLKQRGIVSARAYLAANRTALLLKRAWHLWLGNRNRVDEVRLRQKAIIESRRPPGKPTDTPLQTPASNSNSAGKIRDNGI
jgi:GT2 family glycosyltransferase